MANDQDLEDTSEIGGTGEQPLHEALIANDVSPDGLYVAPLQIQLWEITEIVDTNSAIIFNVPQSDGTHPVWIDYYGPNGFFRHLLVGALYKGVQWNVLEVLGLPEGNGFYHTQWSYKGNWSVHRDKPVLVRKLPQITRVDSLTGTVSGTGVSSGGYFSIVKQYTDEAMSSLVPATQADWSINLLRSVKRGTYSIHVRHTILGSPPRWSAPVTLNYYGVPSFSHLNDNDVIVVPRPQLQGEGFPGATVKIFESGSGVINYGTALVDSNGQWSTVLTESLPERRFVFTANQWLASNALPGWAEEVPVYVRFRPRISPDSATEQAQTFTLTGSDGLVGGTVEVLHDGSNTKYGTSAVLTSEQWSATVVVPPGPVSLVAVNVRTGYRSERSSPRGFKIRPAQFTGVNIEFIGTLIKFSGTAHPGATVEITGPAGTVPPPPVPADTKGDWSTTATGWPYGTGTAQIIQKVGDGASGWIESLPFTFLVENKLPDVSELAFTLDYEPTFSGIGNARATVLLWEIDREVAVAPDVLLTANGPWSSRASETWGPTYKRRIRIKQTVDGQQTEWVYLDVSIPPLAPGLSDPVENGLYPRFSGTCWPGAVVNIQFSDEDDIVHKGEVVGGAWTFRREQAFDPGEHTVTVTQFAAEQTSAPVSATFPITRPMLQPIIVQPHPDGVGRNVTIFGTNGMQGATMQLRDVRFQSPLGPAKQLDAGGVWCIDLTGLEYRRYTIDALQTLNSIPSERSEQRSFDVVLLPPDIDHPTLGGKLPRTAKIVGRGMASGRVEVFLEGLAEPLLTDIAVSREGSWEAEVRLPVGHATLWARQTFRDENDRLQESENSLPLSFDVVPAAPFIETPLEGEQVGQRVVVSGFGEPGDTVTVQLNLGTQNTVVLEDRTWSVTVTSTLSSGFFPLEAKAMYDGFESDPAQRMVEQSAYRPIIDEPAAGRWLSDPVSLAGKGREGTVHVVSWFNPDVKWSPPLDVSGEAWRGESDVPLPPGGNWCRVGQTLDNDPTGVTASDWEVSARVEVVPASLKKT